VGGGEKMKWQFRVISKTKVLAQTNSREVAIKAFKKYQDNKNYKGVQYQILVNPYTDGNGYAAVNPK
jgi:hypothetical protein